MKTYQAKIENSEGQKSGLRGLYGIGVNSKFNFDYSCGLFYQVLHTNWTFEEYN